MAAPAVATYPPLEERPLKDTICLFDVDGTLTPARLEEQLGGPAGAPVTTLFDFCFSENGLTAFKLGQALPSNSFIRWIGEAQYQQLANFVLHYVADLDIPVKRGTFIEFRNGMVNISPVGRNASNKERNEFEAYDKDAKVREKFVEVLKEKFGHLGLTYVLLLLPPCHISSTPLRLTRRARTSFSIGGQISFDVFPTGWDKTYCLKHLETEAEKPNGIAYKNIHFFGDKTAKGGNDYEIYEDPRTIGHSVKGPEDTMAILKEVFGL
ncbi:hypothetical protein LLEC1_01972 [Akanthomyces lecanii]|uniref:Phosphomannomutase n=1 Tax=Cordyceps confragosa TaxID=2714763 RepID=A0A179IDB8_CORDF|nr:hypothetical protein LLEC1_01972 [Akanthomyces lecanii]